MKELTVDRTLGPNTRLIKTLNQLNDLSFVDPRRFWKDPRMDVVDC